MLAQYLSMRGDDDAGVVNGPISIYFWNATANKVNSMSMAASMSMAVEGLCSSSNSPL